MNPRSYIKIVSIPTLIVFITFIFILNKSNHSILKVIRTILNESVIENIDYRIFPQIENTKKDSYLYFDEEVHRRYVSNQNITRIIHQSWKVKEVPLIFRRYYGTWRKCFPRWEHKYWTDVENRNLIAKNYPWFLAKYDSLPQSIYRADCARYVYLSIYGGVYTDLDNECLFPFEHLLANYTFVFGTIDHVSKQTPLKENYVQNSFMYSRPNHPFWIELLLNINNNPVSSNAAVTTGPSVLSNMIDTYRKRYPQTHNIKIYEGRYFNPMTWGDTQKNPKFCKPWNGMSDDQYKQCREFYAKQGSYVVQYHTHVWG